MASAEELNGLLDREKIRDCVARLARGEDRRDPAMITAAYWPDSTSDYSERFFGKPARAGAA